MPEKIIFRKRCLCTCAWLAGLVLLCLVAIAVANLLISDGAGKSSSKSSSSDLLLAGGVGAGGYDRATGRRENDDLSHVSLMCREDSGLGLEQKAEDSRLIVVGKLESDSEGKKKKRKRKHANTASSSEDNGGDGDNVRMRIRVKEVIKGGKMDKNSFAYYSEDVEGPCAALKGNQVSRESGGSGGGTSPSSARKIFFLKRLPKDSSASQEEEEEQVWAPAFRYGIGQIRDFLKNGNW